MIYKPKVIFNDYDPGLDESCITASEVNHEDRDSFSGLYDANGQPLHRPRNRIGYLRN